MEPTKKKKWENGLYKSTDGIKVRLETEPGKKFRISLEPNTNTPDGWTVSILVGDQKFTKIGGSFGNEDRWEDGEALKIIPLFIKGSYVKIEYIDKWGKKHLRTQSLIGFTKAWIYAVDFIGYDPFKNNKELKDK